MPEPVRAVSERWAFHSTDSFRDGALKVVNHGEEAVTIGAVYGQIAGVCYRVGGHPGIAPRFTSRPAG